MKKENQKFKPPIIGKWLLESFCSYDFLSTAQWDLEELFNHNVKTKGLTKAKLLYLIEVFGIITHLFFKGKSQYSINKIAMLKHNIVISLRSFKRFKSTFLINLTGLASGLACTLLIYLWVTDELGTDKFHEKDENLYQVLQNSDTRAGIRTFEYTPALLGQTLMEQHPEVEFSTSVLPASYFEDDSYVISDNNYFLVQEQFVDENFFDVFTFPLKIGDRNSIFKQPNGVLISEDLAQKLTGSKDALGKTIKFQNRNIDEDYIISGIFENIPDNSTLQFDVLFNMKEYLDVAGDHYLNWDYNNPFTFVILNPETDLEQFNQSIHSLIQSFDSRTRTKLFAQRFSERHLYGSYEEGKIVGGRISYIRLFSLVGIVILTIACINFMNLSTAKANTRLKELGVKKALGALRRNLIQQYLTEAMLLTVFSTILGLFLVMISLPFFNQLTGKSLQLSFDQNLVLGVLATIMVTTILSGSYPALYLSRLKTISSLKGKISGTFGDVWARKGLVVFQFSVSIILIVSVLIISSQISYIQSKNLGYERDNVVYFGNSGMPDGSFNAFLSEIKKIPGVIEASGADHNLTGDSGRTTGVDWPGRDPDQRVAFLNLETGVEFIETMAIELKEGRAVEYGRPNEFNKIILNETAIEQMKLDDPVGKTIKLWGRDKQIIGIVKDFHAKSLYEDISPVLIHPVDQDFSRTFVKIQAGIAIETIKKLEETYFQFNDGSPFNLDFVDNAYQAMYEGEKQVASLSKSFAVVAIIISCLGLLGLTAFNADRRAKEIGIRKVLGAEVWRIVYLLSSDFSKMILISLAIGLPVSYFIAKEWIQGFAFAIGLNPFYFISAGLILIAVAWLTVSFQTIKVAQRNPVDSLRME